MPSRSTKKKKWIFVIWFLVQGIWRQQAQQDKILACLISACKMVLKRLLRKKKAFSNQGKYFTNICNSHVYDSFMNWLKIILYFNWHDSEWIDVFWYQNCHCVLTVAGTQDFVYLLNTKKEKMLSFQPHPGQSKFRAFKFNSFSGKIKAIFQLELFFNCGCFISMLRERLWLFVTKTKSLTFFSFVETIPLKLILKIKKK